MNALDQLYRARPIVHTWLLTWSPTMQVIGTVHASTRKLAVSRAPKEYRKYRGEIIAQVQHG